MTTAFDRRIEELVAVGASVTANCGPCLRFHAREAEESGATAEEIAAAVAVGQKVRKGAAAKMDEAAAGVAGPAAAAAGAAAEPAERAPRARGCCG